MLTTKIWQSLKIDIIICTYNRFEKVNTLVNYLNNYSNDFNSIILIDSSDHISHIGNNQKQLKYIRSSHKNQPYQRYLGYLNSHADILLYLDDDVEVANPLFLNILKNVFKDINVSGMAINLVEKHSNTSLAYIPKSVLFKNMAILKKMLNWLSGYTFLPDGKFGLCGLRGKQPTNGGATEWLSGPAFAARKSALFKNFNFQLFDLFEKKLGMGEDAIIGYSLSKQGVFLYHPELLFYHNDQKDSTYSTDHFTYSRRVIYSRLYLSLEKARLDNTNLIWPKLFYHWHTLWRICGLMLNYFIDPTLIRKNLLMGGLEGWRLAFSFKLSNLSKCENYWLNETFIK